MVATVSLILLLLLSWSGCCIYTSSYYPRYRTVTTALSQPLLRQSDRTESTGPAVFVVQATTGRNLHNDDDPLDDKKDHQHHEYHDDEDDDVTPTSTPASSNNNNSGTPSAILSNPASMNRSNRRVVLVGIGIAAAVVGLIALLLVLTAAILRSDKVLTLCCGRHTTKQYHNRLSHPRPNNKYTSPSSSSLKDGPPSSNNNHNNNESTTSQREDIIVNSFSSHPKQPSSSSARSVVVQVLDDQSIYDQSLITMEGFTITGESDAGRATAPLFSIRSGFTIPSKTGGGHGIIITTPRTRTTTTPAQTNNSSMDDNISLSDDIVSCLDSSLAMTDPDPTFVVVTRTVSLPPTRRLGIQIGDTANGPTVRSVRHDSPCADYLFEGDVIVQLGDDVMTDNPHDDINHNGSHNENKVVRLLSATEIAHWLDERCHEPRRIIMVQSRLEQ